MRVAPLLLVVDADETHAAQLCRRLKREGFTAEFALTAAAARHQLSTRNFALVVLDLSMPRVEIASLVGGVRGLITLSANASTLDRIISLEIGADDSMCKSVHPQELVARIRAVLRCRSQGRAPQLIPAGQTTRFDGWKLRRATRLLTSPEGAAVSFPAAEFALLAALLRTPREVLSRAELLDRAFGPSRRASSRSIDLLVSRLRRKLAPIGDAIGPIRTARGSGCLLDIHSIDIVHGDWPSTLPT